MTNKKRSSVNTIYCDLSSGIVMPSMTPIPLIDRDANYFSRVCSWLFKSVKWRLDKDYCIFVPGMQCWIRVPKGFIFNGASIPRPLWPFLAPTGILFLPSLLHDFGYKYQCLLGIESTILLQSANRAQFDKVFRSLSIEVNRLKVVSNIAWGFLYLFGWKAWNQARKLNLSVDCYLLTDEEETNELL